MVLARYKTLVDRLAVEIRAGRIVPGVRLPTHRSLAAREGIALVTASRIYAELEAMGLVKGETGRGTFVREHALPRGLGIDQPAAASGLLDLNFNHPSLPGQADLLRAALRRLAASGDLDALLRYQPHGGRPHERDTVARHLAGRGVVAGGERVLIVDGAQHGLAVTAMALFQPGDVIAVDALTYSGFKVLAAGLHLELAPLPADGQGPDMDALDALCRRRRVRGIYTMPTVHNPLGWVTGLRERQQLVAVARRHGLVIIEDAAYAFLEAQAPPPLAALAPEATVYVSGLSKNVATGLRVGFVAVPAPWVPKLERAIRGTTWNTPGVMTAIACGWLDDGTVGRLETEKRADATARQRIAKTALHGLRYVAHPASYVVWLPMPEGVRADIVCSALQARGVSVSTADAFATAAQVPNALRLALGSVDLESLRHALDTVREVIVDLVDR